MLAYTAYLSGLYSLLVLFVYFRALKIDETKNALDLGFLIMIFGLLGARLSHVFYENPEYYAENWIRVLQIWSGGFVFYGGAISAFVACFVLVKRRHLDWKFWGDFYAPVIALGYGFGRVSCWLAGCCYGRACDLPWAIDGRHPAQLYAVGWELVVAAGLLVLERRNRAARSPLLKTGFVFFLWLSLHSLGRLMMEHYRGDFRGSLWLGQSISTWVSFALLVISVIGLRTHWHVSDKSSNPGPSL
jgi:phosphatidylglycerol:prolipoprotein diacylglycerol transferase